MTAILLQQPCYRFSRILQIRIQLEFKIKHVQALHLNNPNFDPRNKLIMNPMKHISLQFTGIGEKLT